MKGPRLEEEEEEESNLINLKRREGEGGGGRDLWHEGGGGRHLRHEGGEVCSHSSPETYDAVLPHNIFDHPESSFEHNLRCLARDK